MPKKDSKEGKWRRGYSNSFTVHNREYIKGGELQVLV